MPTMRRHLPHTSVLGTPLCHIDQPAFVNPCMSLVNGVGGLDVAAREFDKPGCRNGVSTANKQIDFTVALLGKRLSATPELVLYAGHVRVNVFDRNAIGMIAIESYIKSM